MEERKVREIRQMIFDGKYRCINIACEPDYICETCPLGFCSVEHFKLFGRTGNYVPIGVNEL